MIKFQLELNIGGSKLTITEDAETQVEAIHKASTWQGAMPTSGPVINGKRLALPTDLTLCSRDTKDNKGGDCRYQSLVSESLGYEFRLGQNRKGGRVFPKTWEKIQRKNTFQQGEDDNGESLSDPPPSANGTAPAGQETKASAFVPDPAQITKDAENYVRLGFVSHAPKPDQKMRWNVGEGGKHSTVWKDQAGLRQCNCPALIKGRAADPSFDCSHIKAVALWHAKQAEPAKV